jgi:hypothetical protein
MRGGFARQNAKFYKTLIYGPGFAGLRNWHVSCNEGHVPDEVCCVPGQVSHSGFCIAYLMQDPDCFSGTGVKSAAVLLHGLVMTR